MLDNLSRQLVFFLPKRPTNSSTVQCCNGNQTAGPTGQPGLWNTQTGTREQEVHHGQSELAHVCSVTWKCRCLPAHELKSFRCCPWHERRIRAAADMMSSCGVACVFCTVPGMDYGCAGDVTATGCTVHSLRLMLKVVVVQW